MQSRNDQCDCGSGKKYKNCCMIITESSFVRKYGYKVLGVLIICFFIGAFYNKYINAQPTVWCYECQKYVLESSKGHQTEPPSDN